jgi:RNA polymerase sigma-70 factor (ECF subfamily)
MIDDDAALIAEIRDGSERAFNMLVDRHQQAVRAFLRRLLSDVSEADDLAQETFIVAWTKPATYRGGASVRSWLFGIAWRKAKGSQRTWFRRRRREDEWARERTDQEVRPTDPDEVLVMRALNMLPTEQRAAVILCLTAGASHSEVAEILGAPLGTVKSHVARGKARLLEMLGDPT